MEASQQTNNKASECLSSALASLIGNGDVPVPVPVSVPDTVTENGAPAFSDTKDLCLNLFVSCVRDTPEEKIRSLLASAWAEDSQTTLAILLHLRDCRNGKDGKGGKGEKALTRFALLWLRENHPCTYLINLPEFINHGCFKDLCELTKLVYQKKYPILGKKTWVELEYLSEFVKEDSQKLSQTANQAKVPITLVFKWLPTENTHFDYKDNGNQAWVLAHLLYPELDGMKAMRVYRKELSKGRENLKIVEKLLSSKRYDEIDFASLPAKAHRLLRKAFQKHAPEQYNAYLQLLSEGKAKINSTGTQPHELVNVYLTQGGLDQTIEGQWRDVLKKLASAGTLGSAMAISDVSGSMSGQPMQVAIALGILLSELIPEPFKGQLITFSADPTLHQVTGNSLYDKVNSVKNMPWGMNTNLLAVFKLLLGFAKSHQVSKENMPKTLFIFTDMQFDVAERNPWKTTYQTIQDLYAEGGYDVPFIVFWNLRDVKPSFPVTADTPGVALVSGFSAELLRTFMSGDLLDMTPTKVMLQTLVPYLELVKVHPTDSKL